MTLKQARESHLPSSYDTDFMFVMYLNMPMVLLR